MRQMALVSEEESELQSPAVTLPQEVGVGNHRLMPSIEESSLNGFEFEFTSREALSWMRPLIKAVAFRRLPRSEFGVKGDIALRCHSYL